ncbi:hypothetical protein ACHHYP_13570 [Achlya hypogyna]|uniref:LNR domain-containing protein n=1 Tax=Achlya hypogyna TaxID=1202772 RepID=A0A1V9YF19_ACHHY|nr:hypothetical protein ACHHYP_13570 [Achlya hypogyna]
MDRMGSDAYLFGWWQRVGIRAVAVLLLLASMFYLLSFALVYLFISPDHARVLRLWAPKLNAVVHFGLAALHLVGIVRAVRPVFSKTSAAVVPFDSKLPRLSCWSRVWAVYDKYFSRYGLYGLLGPLYEVKTMAKQTVQIPAQLYQAYHISWLLTDSTASLLYTIVLAANCVVIPSIMAHRSRFVRRWGAAFLDMIFNFLLSCGLPIGFVLRAFAAYYVAGDIDIVTDHAWLNQTVLLGRFIMVSSPLDLVIKIVPFVTCFLSLSSMAQAVHVKLTYTTRWFLPHPVLVVLGVTAQSPGKCPPGCLLQTYPWLATNCTCIMLRINCLRPEQPPAAALDAYLTTHVQHVFDLEIDQCDLPNALSATTMRELTNLYSLTLQRTNTVGWDIAPEDLPPSLVTVFLCHVHLPRVPAALATVGSLQYIFLRNVSLYADASLPPSFAKLSMLDLTNASQRSVPSCMLQPLMTNINLHCNNITELPAGFAALSRVTYFNMVNNSISSVPATVANALESHQVMHLEGNPIDALPETIDFAVLATGRLVVRDTPLCARLHRTADAVALPALERQLWAMRAEVCRPECNVGCHESLIGNSDCNIECFTPACDWDGSDCAAFDF